MITLRLRLSVAVLTLACAAIPLVPVAVKATPVTAPPLAQGAIARDVREVGDSDVPVVSSRAGVLRLRLVAREQHVSIDGVRVLAKVYNGGFVGPTMAVSPGDTMRIRLVNRLDEMTNLHFHGMFVSPKARSDNIFRMVHPGETAHYVVRVPADHDPGLYWYHPHMHGLVEPQIFAGMSGTIVVRGLKDRLPVALQDITTRMLALKDYQVQDGAIPQANIDSGAPTTRTVNGVVRPTFTIAPGETQLWRIANIGADIWYDIHIPNHRMVVIAHDGAPAWDVWSAKHLVMPPGQRYEVLVTGKVHGVTPIITRAFDQGPDGDRYPERVLARVRTRGPSQPAEPMPTSVAPDTSLRGSDVDVVRRIRFSEEAAANEFFIDGQRFDPRRNDVEPDVNTVERWVIRNVTRELHPFHIHVNNFQVLRVNGRPVPLRGPQDVIRLPIGGRVVMITEFTRFTGRYVFHCHIAAHEDNGMMATVKVV